MIPKPVEWVDVEIPSKANPHSGNRAPGLPKGSRTTKTMVYRAKLLEIFKFPPEDYDGTNKKLSEYMGLSVRQVIRLLKQLEAAKQIKVDRYFAGVHPEVGCYTRRLIQVVREQ